VEYDRFSPMQGLIARRKKIILNMVLAIVIFLLACEIQSFLDEVQRAN
jgi:hypothetical protein